MAVVTVLSRDAKVVALALVLLVSGCAHTDAWTTGDTVLESVYIASVVADGLMTARIQDHPNIVEHGMIARHALGRNPNTADVWLYMGTSAVAHILIARMLPKAWRTAWQVGPTVSRVLAVNKGHQIGVFSEPCTTVVPEGFECSGIVP